MISSLAMENEAFTINDLREDLRAVLEKMNIDKLSDVQAAVIPAVLQGNDLKVRADTASGKTFAFAIPVIMKLQPQGHGRHNPQALILVPTRELAIQTADVFRSLLQNTEGIRTAVLCGGSDMNRQVRAFSKGADIVVATPGRLKDHIRRHTFKTPLCRMLVIDEADMMMSFGFYEDAVQCAESLSDHQTVLLSATWNDEVTRLADTLLSQPQTITMASETVHPQSIAYECFLIGNRRKISLTARLIEKCGGQVIVFCNTRRTADFVCTQLQLKGISAASVHSESDSHRRKEIMRSFRHGDFHVMCATDVLARGIDLPAVDLIILYDLPADKETILHRCGRTSRQMRNGKAVFLLEPSESGKIHSLEKIFDQPVKVHRN